MESHYRHALAARRLRACYAIAPPRVRQYLQAEMEHAAGKVRPGAAVLDLGCGYGRAMPLLAAAAGSGRVIGIDISRNSLTLASTLCRRLRNCLFVEMDASRPAFREGVFDFIVCIQNGISAFHVDPAVLIRESIRIARRGGLLLFSTYAESFWEHRLEWFRLQSAAGLLAEIDEKRTGNGVIVCKDGFSATTFSEAQFRALTADLPADVSFTLVDNSSLFCEIMKI